MDTNGFKGIIKGLTNISGYTRGQDVASLEVKLIIEDALARVKALRQEHNPWESVFIEEAFNQLEQKNQYLTVEAEHKTTVNFKFTNLRFKEINGRVPQGYELVRILNQQALDEGIRLFEFQEILNRGAYSSENSPSGFVAIIVIRIKSNVNKIAKLTMEELHYYTNEINRLIEENLQ